MEYLVISSVDVPCLVPLITILANGKGSFIQILCLKWFGYSSILDKHCKAKIMAY